MLLIAHEGEPALQSRRAQNAAASTASLPAFVTMANAPLVGWDKKSSRSDLGWLKTEIFLQSGLDRNSVICPSGVLMQPVGQQIVGWVEPFAKPIAFARSMMGIASAFAR
jgi:hypothetical protein